MDVFLAVLLRERFGFLSLISEARCRFSITVSGAILDLDRQQFNILFVDDRFLILYAQHNPSYFTHKNFPSSAYSHSLATSA